MIPFEREPQRGRGGRPGRGSFGRRGAIDDALAQQDDPHTPSKSAQVAPRESPLERAGWLIGPLLLFSVAATMLFIFRGPDQIFGIAFGVVLSLGLLWILVSALLPAKPDRKCPQCGRDKLVRIDARKLHGLRCRACSWRDETASAFIHAEDDGGALEDIVLRERSRPPRP